MAQLKPAHLFVFTDLFVAEQKGLRDALSAFLAGAQACIPPSVHLVRGEHRIHMGNLIYVSPRLAVEEMLRDAPGPTFIVINEAKDADLIPLIAAAEASPRTVRMVEVLGMKVVEYPLKFPRP